VVLPRWKQQREAANTVHWYSVLPAYAARPRIAASGPDPCVQNGQSVDAVDHGAAKRVQWRGLGAVNSFGAADEHEGERQNGQL